MKIYYFKYGETKFEEDEFTGKTEKIKEPQDIIISSDKKEIMKMKTKIDSKYGNREGWWIDDIRVKEDSNHVGDAVRISIHPTSE